MAQHSADESLSTSNRRSPLRYRIWVSLSVILIIALYLLGFWRVRYLHNSALAHWEGQLSSVADVTKFAIQEWIQDRLTEMRELSFLLAERTELFETDASSGAAAHREQARNELRPFLELTRQQNVYLNIWVTDIQGRVLLTCNEESMQVDDIRAAAVRSVQEGRRQIIGPFFDSRGVLTLIFALPIPSSAKGSPASDQKYTGTVLLTVDPSRFLFPLISVDSMPTRTGEYILVAKALTKFQVLSPLRHPPTPALSVQLPWDTAPELCRLPVEKESAFGEFTDFRGTKVIAVTRHISGDVGLIRQIDQSEAYAAYRTQARTEGMLAFAILAALALALLAFQRAERASRLREVAASESRLSGIINAAMDAIVALDADLRITLFNAAAERIFQCRAADAVGKSALQFLPERFSEQYRAEMERFNRSDESERLIQASAGLCGLRSNGEEFPIEVSVSKMIAGGDRVFLTIVCDITERKRAEVLLRSTEEKYRRLFEESREGVFISSAEGKFLDINPAGLELFGYDSKEELMRVDIAKTLYFNPQDRDEIRRAHEAFGYVKDYEIVLRRRDGQRRIVLETSNSMRDEGGKIIGYRGFLRDITERKSLERQLLQSQKMDAVGQLAGGIAHDFNNILTAILGYSELLQSQSSPDDPHLRDIQEIARAAGRAAALTRQLLAFSRRQVMQPRVLGLNSLVAEMNKMLCRLITESIELRTILEPDLGQVRADPAQIEQVILNLAVNARDAMPSGGRLTIESGNVQLSETLPALPMDVPSGRYVMVSVSDTGHGMDAEVQARIFEPFFTTKEIGKGTGLGLSMVYGIVKQSGGFITVQSDGGRGTVFRVYLPRIEALETAVEKPAAPSHSLEGSETILLVEDEASVRVLARDTLARHKYRVIEATNGREAITFCQSFNETLHIMVTDMVMPQMGGRQLALELASIHPETQVLYISGYADVEIGKDSHLKPGKNFLAKPFAPLDLVRMVRHLLDENASGPA